MNLKRDYYIGLDLGIPNNNQESCLRQAQSFAQNQMMAVSMLRTNLAPIEAYRGGPLAEAYSNHYRFMRDEILTEVIKPAKTYLQRHYND